MRKMNIAKLGGVYSISDIAQSALVQVLDQLERLIENVGNIPQYLREVARNKFLEYLRFLHAEKRNIDKVVHDQAVLDIAFRDEDSASAMIVTAEEYERSMNRLSPEERQLVWARLCGYEWAEVAALCGLPSGEAARKRFERIIERLRGDLGGDAK